MGKRLRILVLADTHNHLPAKLDELANGVDEIWHLGDVCAPAILETIRESRTAINYRARELR